MSDLQLGLIVIGVAIIAGVYAFNRWQERQLRRHANDARSRPAPSQSASISAEPGSAQERVEPHLNHHAGESEAEDFSTRAMTDVNSARKVRIEPTGDAVAVNSPIDYLCTVEADNPMPYDVIGELVSSAHAIGKRVTLQARDEDTGQWREVALGEPRAIMRLAIGLQLADRSGPANRVQLATMRDLVRNLAQRLGAKFECPDIDGAARVAGELDAFCSEVDISVGCNIVPNGTAGLAGTKVRGLLESAGYTLENDGKFWLHSDDGKALIRAEDPQGKSFTAERLRSETLAGLTLSMDVPNVPANGRLFDRMVETARQIAQALDAAVVDDNRTPLTEPGLQVIRQQLHKVHAALEAQGIEAGSAMAARLFS